MEAVSETTYTVPGGTVTLHARTAEGWRIVDTDGSETTVASIPAFMAWCRANYSWPMPESA